jgi:3-oxoacyl-[acyl-carrier-protein] synthase II
MRDVWITGVGAVTSLGIGVGPFWKAYLEGTSGIKPIQKFSTAGMPFPCGAELVPLSPDGWLSPEELARWSTLAAATVSAARQALADADFLSPRQGCRDASVKLFIGTSSGDLNDIERGLRREWAERGGPDLQAGIAHYLERQPFGFLAQTAQAVGVRNAQSVNTNTCAAAGYAISLAADQIRLGREERVLCGAADFFAEVVQAGFSNLRALAPAQIRPFDRHREGTMLGDAVVMFLLEDREAAQQRGIKPWAQLAGEGWSADAYHISAPRPQGEGLAKAMRRALADARLAPEQISCVVAHGTGTPSNDRAEAQALHQVFGAALPPVTAFKSRVGHTQGAAQALDTLAAVCMLRDQVIPPVLHLGEPDPECQLPLVTTLRRDARLETCLVNAMGFGGNNLSLILRQAGQGRGAA